MKALAFTRYIKKFLPTATFLVALLSTTALPILMNPPSALAYTDTYPTSIGGCRAVSGTPSGSFTCDLKDSTQDEYFDPWSEENRECTSYVAWMLSSVNGFTMPFYGDAKSWGTIAAGAPYNYTVNMTPAVGSVYWSNAGTFGHVAYVQSVSSDGTHVDTTDYNSDFTGHWAQELNVATSSATGYIHFKDTSGGGTSTTYHTPMGIVFNGALNAFTVAGDNGLYGEYWNGSNWTGFTNLNTNVMSNPNALINTNNNSLNLFTRNGDNQVYNAYNTGSGLSPWSSLGSHQMVGTPTSIMRSSTEQDVFALDTSKVPYEDTWTSTNGWGSGWYSLGNLMASGASPAAITYGSEIDLFYRGGDNNVYKNTCNQTSCGSASNWGGFGSLGTPTGTTIVGDPSVVSYSAEGEYDIWVNTTSQHVYKRSWTGSGWTNWADWGGSFVGNPYSMQFGNDMYVFARDNNANLEYRYWSYSTQGWSNWIVLSSGKLASDPYAVQNGSQLTVFDNGNDGKTYLNTCSQSACSSSSSWGSFVSLP